MTFEIILATNNKHKLKEVREILTPHKVIVYGLDDLNLKPKKVEENGKTYAENALIKAKSVQELTTMPIISDDSGLEILALNHEPGLHSARYAASLGGHDQAINELLKRLEGKDRSAQFVCDIVLVNIGDKPLIFEGIAKGKIAEKKMGEGGFGYDPIFISDETGTCFGLMKQEEKNTVSHRAKALKKLLTYLKINGFVPL